MSRRHVLITADAVGGVWTHALDLAAGLVAAGDTATLAVLGPPPSAAQAADAAAAGVWVVETDLPLDWQAGSEAELDRAAAALGALARQLRVDLVHLNAPMLAAGLDAGVPVVGGCHSCLASWWSVVRGGDMPPAFVRRTRRLAWGYRACAALVAPSRWFADLTRHLYGVTPDVVWNGRTLPAPHDGARAPVVLTAGRLWDQGKQAALLDAAAAHMRHPVVAAGPLAAPGEAPVGFASLQWAGNLAPADLAARLGQARLFASLATYEPFGLAVLEAAQAGCALVLADTPVFRELWDGAAVFVDPHDPVRLARRLDELAGDGRQCLALGLAARTRGRRYRRDAMVAGIRAVHGRVLDGGAVPAGAAA